MTVHNAFPAAPAEEHYDPTGSRFGMWLFLFTEILLFGGLFLLYSVYRAGHPAEFHLAAGELNLAFGTFNTVLLLTSSLTMACSITAIRLGNARLSTLLLLATILFGLVFLFDKYLEWGSKIHHGIFPGSPALLERPAGEVLFFGLYYVMTGLHGVHVLAGVALLSYVLYLVVKGRVDGNRYAWLENSGLYWHLVDIIWIFLFPLLYLIT